MAYRKSQQRAGADRCDNGSAHAATGFREPGRGSKLASASHQERLQLFVEGPGPLVVRQKGGILEYAWFGTGIVLHETLRIADRDRTRFDAPADQAPVRHPRPE